MGPCKRYQAYYHNPLEFGFLKRILLSRIHSAHLQDDGALHTALQRASLQNICPKCWYVLGVPVRQIRNTVLQHLMVCRSLGSSRKHKYSPMKRYTKVIVSRLIPSLICVQFIPRWKSKFQEQSIQQDRKLSPPTIPQQNFSFVCYSSSTSILNSCFRVATTGEPR